jgi:hypothetical protein
MERDDTEREAVGRGGMLRVRHVAADLGVTTAGSTS